MKMLGIAIAIAADLFKDVTDAQGEPYILHCLKVMEDSEDEEEAVCSVVHDVPEDCFPTIEKGIQYLRERGISETCLKTIDLLSHRKDEDYISVYIRRIATERRATRIKKKDLRHNSDLTRIKGALTKKHFDKVEKYHTAYTYLSNI